MAKIKQLIIHCSASDYGDADTFRDWHVRGNGWSDIGYHYVILNGFRKSGGTFNPAENGIVEPGRPLDQNDYIDVDERGAHAYGFNHQSLGVCMVGNKLFTREQFVSLWHIVDYWKTLIPEIEVIGHYQVNTTGKTCPNFDVPKFTSLAWLETDSAEYHLVRSLMAGNLPIKNTKD